MDRMRIKTFLIGALLTLFFPIFASSSNLGKETPVTLIYTSNTLGEAEPGCCSYTKGAGGLARRAHYIKTVKEETNNLLVLDAGDALTGLSSNEMEKENNQKKARVILKIYEKMGYDVLNIGDTDLQLGIEYLKALQKDSKIHFLSASLKDPKTGKTIFKPYFVKMMNGLKVGMIGLITPVGSPYTQKEAKKIKDFYIEDPVKAANETIHSFMSDCHHIIALAHLSSSEIESFAQKVPQISVIIGGDDRTFMFPRKINHSIWVQTDSNGLRVGRLDLRLLKEASEFVDIMPMTLIKKNIEEIQKRMENSQSMKEIMDLKKMQDILQATLFEKKKKLPTKGKNTYKNVLTLLHPGMESDKEIEKLIDSSRDQLKRPIP